MAKRKVEVYLNAGACIEEAGCELAPKECPAEDEAKTVDAVPTGLVSAQGVSTNQKAEGVDHVARGGAWEDDLFWSLLERAGSQVW